MLEDLDLNDLQDIQQARKCIVMLLNLVENLKLDNQKLREQVQRLRDEINRLKGEQGKPNTTPNRKKRDHVSCEQERREAERLEVGCETYAPSLEKAPLIFGFSEKASRRFLSKVGPILRPAQVLTSCRVGCSSASWISWGANEQVKAAMHNAKSVIPAIA